MKISIIVPVYNREIFLDKCLNSIYAQKYSDWECLLCDDGSTDTSPDICKLWETKDSRFKVLKLNHAGPSTARNAGLKAANGKYLTFIDSDDYVNEKYISDMVEALSPDTELVVSGMVEFGRSDGVWIEQFEKTNTFLLTADHHSFFDYYQKTLLFHSQCCKLFSAKIIKAFNLSFNESLTYGEDLSFMIEYLRNIKKMTCIPSANYFYRRHSHNTLTKSRPVTFNQWYALLMKEKDLLMHLESWNEYSKEHLQRKMWHEISCEIATADTAFFSYSRIKQLLSIPELDEMRKKAKIFRAKKRFRWLVLNRQSVLLFLTLSLKTIRGKWMRCARSRNQSHSS